MQVPFLSGSKNVLIKHADNVLKAWIDSATGQCLEHGSLYFAKIEATIFHEFIKCTSTTYKIEKVINRNGT